MYLKCQKRRKHGAEYEYWELVRTVRTASGPRHETVAYLGRLEECEALVLQTDFADIGSFACSDPTFSALMAATDRAYRSNFVNGFPTDCPHREKNGWTADAALASEYAMYAYENTAAYAVMTWMAANAEGGFGSVEKPAEAPQE